MVQLSVKVSSAPGWLNIGKVYIIYSDNKQ